MALWSSLAGPSSQMHELQVQRQQEGEQLREAFYTHFCFPDTCSPALMRAQPHACECEFGGWADKTLSSTLAVLVVDKPVMGCNKSL